VSDSREKREGFAGSIGAHVQQRYARRRPKRIPNPQPVLSAFDYRYAGQIGSNSHRTVKMVPYALQRTAQPPNPR
jgi:hypothetical protein